MPAAWQPDTTQCAHPIGWAVDTPQAMALVKAGSKPTMGGLRCQASAIGPPHQSPQAPLSPPVDRFRASPAHPICSDPACHLRQLNSVFYRNAEILGGCMRAGSQQCNANCSSRAFFRSPRQWSCSAAVSGWRVRASMRSMVFSSASHGSCLARPCETVACLGAMRGGAGAGRLGKERSATPTFS
jgi:hypothetical protein